MKENFFEQDVKGSERQESKIIQDQNQKENSLNKKEVADGKLSEHEAMLYQDYASSLSGKSFSEKVDDKSYQEAEIFLEKLKGRQIDGLNIRWDKLDLRDISQYKEVEERLDEAVRCVIRSTKDRNLITFLEKYKGIILPIALSVAILVNADNKISAGEIVKLYQMGEKITFNERVFNLPSYITVKNTTNLKFLHQKEPSKEWAFVLNDVQDARLIKNLQKENIWNVVYSFYDNDAKKPEIAIKIGLFIKLGDDEKLNIYFYDTGISLSPEAEKEIKNILQEAIHMPFKE